MKRTNIFVASFIVAAALAGCGGGGGGGGTPPTPAPNPAPAPPPRPQPPPAPPPPTTSLPNVPWAQRPEAGQGVVTATGIQRIPLSAVKVTNREMATMYAIMEYKGIPTEPDAYSPPGNRRTPHSDDVRRVACHSYIRACEDPFGPDAPFQFHLGVRYPTGELVALEHQQNARQQMEKILRELPATVKLVSVSFGGPTPPALLGADAPFAMVESAGNEDRDTFLDPDVPEDEALRNMRAAAVAGKALHVAGYNVVKALEGVYENSGTGCRDLPPPRDGFSQGCIWAPNGFYHPIDVNDEDRIVSFGGTSASAPHVASALASVLAVFPETGPWELIRLAKACAIPTPSLPGGVGRADFTCMTSMGDDGQWELVSADEFARLIAPAAMNSLAFPGDARVSSTFVVGRSGRSATLATRVRGTFRFSAGVPALSLGEESGFFPVVVGAAEAPILGGGFLAKSGLFAAVATGDRDTFFGLGKEYGYSGTRSVDVNVGHERVYARFSRQWSRAAPLVEEVRGDAVGVTAKYPFRVSPETRMEVAAHMDRFAGGEAATVFGPVTIAGTRWNRSAAVSMEHAFSGSGTLTVTADKYWQARGESTAGVSVGYRLEF